MDPTPGADFATWIIRMRINKSIRGDEDFDKVKERLEQFTKLKRTPRFTAPKDINQYKTFSDLAKTIDQFANVKSKGEEARVAVEQGVTKLGERDGFICYLVTTPEAAAKLFRETDWCVKDPKYFKNYADDGDKNFYFIWHTDKTKWALAHFDSDQLRDSHDGIMFDITNDENVDQAHVKVVHDLLKDTSGYKALLKKFPAGTITQPPYDMTDEIIGHYLGSPYYWSAEDLSNLRDQVKAGDDAAVKAWMSENGLKATDGYHHLKDIARDMLDDGDYDIQGTQFAALLVLDGRNGLASEPWIRSADSYSIAKDEASDAYNTIERNPDEVYKIFKTMLLSQDTDDYIKTELDYEG